ncbi:aclacinomycin-N/aclacinomycin-A oxidase-like [Sycon ciliatum]|uniref:aclacinomycin-N/aclacinomycin-A oxidase-like n=1 Tax=Sycon ciliatum TaxID=27933 RepID=UPI0031F65542
MVSDPEYGFQPPSESTRGRLRFVEGNVFYPVSQNYTIVRRPWQSFYSCNAYPTVVVQTKNANDVILTLEYAEENNLRVAVRNGGHSYAGISRSYGLVLDVSLMNNISVTPQQADNLALLPLVKVGAGQTIFGGYYELAKHNLTLTGGSCPSVGISGLTLGGGVGVLSRKWGLMSDQVYSIDAVVYEDQSYKAVTATADNQYSDLFFAFRGGMGGNYGVVTSWMYRAHHITTVYTSTFSLDLVATRSDNGTIQTDAYRYMYIWDAISNFTAWCDDISNNTNCEMAISTTPLPKDDLESPNRAEAQLAKSFNLESSCICNRSDCSACEAEVNELERVLRTVNASTPWNLYTSDISPEEGVPWREYIWTLAGCTQYYNATLYNPGQYPPISLAQACIEHAQAAIGRAEYNRKKSLFLSKNPDSNLIMKVLDWFDSFSENIIVDTYTAANVEFYYWRGALASPPSYAADSAWRHRDEKWLAHITGRFPQDATPETIANVYYALGTLHSIFLNAEKSNTTRIQDYQNFADGSLSYEGWSHFYFDQPTIERLSKINYKYNPNDIFRNELSVPLVRPCASSSSRLMSAMFIVMVCILASST